MGGLSDDVTFGQLGYAIAVAAFVVFLVAQRWWARGLIASEVGQSA